MSYSYQAERAWIFTEEGQRMFLKIRDRAHELLRLAGAFRYSELLSSPGFSGDSWALLACVDRLVELGEIIELKRDCWAQFAVYTTPQVDNR